MNVKRKYLFWLIPAVLVLLAVLFFLYPGRADTILHMPESAAGIREVYFQRIEPVHETLEYFCQDYTLTAEREPELLQEVCDWLYAARLNRPMPGSGGLHNPGATYTQLRDRRHSDSGGRPRRGKRRALPPAPEGHGGAERHLPTSEYHLRLRDIPNVPADVIGRDVFASTYIQ